MGLVAAIRRTSNRASVSNPEKEWAWAWVIETGIAVAVTPSDGSEQDARARARESIGDPGALLTRLPVRPINIGFDYDPSGKYVAWYFQPGDTVNGGPMPFFPHPSRPSFTDGPLEDAHLTDG